MRTLLKFTLTAAILLGGIVGFYYLEQRSKARRNGEEYSVVQLPGDLVESVAGLMKSDEEPSPEPEAEVGTAYGGLALLPFFKACRAGIRAKVGALALRGSDLPASASERDEARAYLALALRYLVPAPAARLIAVGGSRSISKKRGSTPR